MSARHLFRVSEAVALALHSAAILAESDGRLVRTKELAEALQASENHLAKVMQRLVRADIVSSTRGPSGGFRLARETDEVTLLDIYEAIEGTIEVSGCLFDRPVCDGRFCILGTLVQRLERETKEYLERTTLTHVVERRMGNQGGAMGGTTCRS